MELEEKTKTVHLLMMPYPAEGHMRAMLDLAHRLALRRGLALTIITTPKNLPALSPLLSAHPSTVRSLVLPFPPHPGLNPGAENVRDIGNRGNLPIISALRSLHQPISDWFHSHPDPPVAIISDFFLGWTQRLAVDLGIARIAFFSVSAFFISIWDHCWQNSTMLRPLPVVPFPDLPNSPSFREEHLPTLFRLYQENHANWEHVKDDMIANTASWKYIINSFEALESSSLNHLKRKMGHDRVHCVGPLSLVGLDNGSDRVTTDDSVFGWLDGCPDGSVLYVGFGSQKVMKREQIEALAYGIENSGARFMWAVKMGSAQQEDNGLGPILDEFEARVGGRGKILRGWAPQVAILRHRAVGGFLTHCGWNSILEATVAGVNLLAWPMEADQYVNAGLLVENKGMAFRVCEGADTVPDPEKLSRAIAEWMRQDTEERARAKEWSDKALAAVLHDGSSSMDLEALVKEVILLGQAKK